MFTFFHSPLDQIFHDVAYKAKDRSDLLAGIDEFLDQVTVLPPGEWDPSIRIEPPKNVPSQVNKYKDEVISNDKGNILISGLILAAVNTSV